MKFFAVVCKKFLNFRCFLHNNTATVEFRNEAPGVDHFVITRLCDGSGMWLFCCFSIITLSVIFFALDINHTECLPSYTRKTKQNYIGYNSLLPYICCYKYKCLYNVIES